MENKKQIYYKYFEENILPVIKSIEQDRKMTAVKIVLFSVLFFITGLIFAWLFIYNAIYHEFNPLILPVLLFLMYIFILKSITDSIIAGKEYRKKLVKGVLPLFWKPIANFKKWPKNYDTEAIINSQLFSNFDTREDNLSFFGHYEGTNILVSDTKLTLPVKASVKPDLFKGTIIQLELPKSINNHVIFLSDNEQICNKFKRINLKTDELCIFAKNTGNLDFINEGLYKIIEKFAKFYIAKGFLMSIKDNVVLIAIRQKNPMQFGFLFKSLLNAKNYDELIDRFIVIFELIDILN